jgi:hypothetical protein
VLLEENFVGTTFDAELIDVTWTNSNGTKAEDFINKCGLETIVGGFDSDFSRCFELERKIKNIPEHDKIRIEFDVYLMDSWNDDEYLTLKLDDAVVSKLTKEFKGEKLCGAHY